MVTTNYRLKDKTNFEQAGKDFAEVSEREANIIEHLQKTTVHLREAYVMFKNEQDERCKPFEEKELGIEEKLNDTGTKEMNQDTGNVEANVSSTKLNAFSATRSDHTSYGCKNNSRYF